MEEAPIEPQNTAKKGRGLNTAVSIISGTLFYVVLLTAALIVFAVGKQSNQARVIFGYSVFTVLSGSMQSELPKETLIVVKGVDTGTIEAGDDITFVRSDHVIVTHQVVEVIEDYQNSGMRGFQTKGLENEMADREIVYADNVVGKVVYSNLELGIFIGYLKSRLWLVGIMIGLAAAIDFVVKYLVRTGKKQGCAKTPGGSAVNIKL